MPERSFKMRVSMTAALLIGATILLQASNQRVKTPLRKPLDNIPLVLGEWRGIDIPMTDRIIAASSVDDYVNRVYHGPGDRTLEFYVGYYGSQRNGELIHSPRNCLPGSGWEWVRKGRLDVALQDHAPIRINDFHITKGVQHNLVLYWYQGRGRAIASEYTAKIWMMADAMFRHRTDGSLVRLIVPIRDSEENARALGVRFLWEIYPRLNQSIPD